MNVLITGGAGYIGSVCAELFLNEGHCVTVYDNLVEGHRQAVDARAELVVGDCLDRELLAQTLRKRQIEAVIHFAAFALVGESMQFPGKYFLNNTVGAQSVLDACVAANARKIIFSSTCATYGAPESEALDESHPQRPVNPYGESKLLVERMLPWYEKIHGLEFVALRYFNAAGASEAFGEHHRVETHLIPNVLKVALGQSQQCSVFGSDYPTPDGSCVRDYVHVRDLAAAHLLALERGKSGFYNLGTGTGYSVLEVIRACEKVGGRKIPFSLQPRRPGDPAKLVAAPKKAFEELRWAPRLSSLEQIVSTAWDWHLRHPSGYVTR
ncbi:MAG: UDP-glucose 4-epimerase GalE [Verrucomicrobia bacterium]|nr:UDP-glucose 4-epimerase GalE [Verrucomicrobiota bacterium]MBI3871125.1 UDP-glucose 4-epimerase GalE [Verrucomicrobiota bacterium]